MLDEPGQTASGLLALNNRRVERGYCTIDATGIVVSVPGSAVTLPDCVLDPLLYMFVETVGNVLAWDPGFDVVALHLLDHLNGVLADAKKWASD
jgi:hypothetical protein